MVEHIELDAVVIGGGVVGLAVARELALAGRAVTVLEAEPTLGMHSSSRNSEVIHAGIYYEPGSLKARTCVDGRRALYDYCERRGVAHARIGKIIVASRDEEIPVLTRLKAQAETNGVTDLVWLSRQEVSALEPAIDAVCGMLSPSTGIIDSHEYLSALRIDAEAAGAVVVTSSPVLAGRVTERGIELSVGSGEPFTALCSSVVNAAGLRAQEVARAIAGLPIESVPAQHFAKGHYFVLGGPARFNRLVYPVPVPGGLGIHLTLDLARQARFGPDVSWLNGVDYSFDEQRADAFYTAIRTYFPALPDDALSPGYTGIRAKLGPAGSGVQDFLIQGPADHGVPQLVNLFGIESPGLTASLALAKHTLSKLNWTSP